MVVFMYVCFQTLFKMSLFAIQTVRASSFGEDEAELPSVQEGNLHRTSQPAGNSTPKCY